MATLRRMTSDEPEDVDELYPLEYEKHSEEKINAVKTLLKMLPGAESEPQAKDSQSERREDS